MSTNFTKKLLLSKKQPSKGQKFQLKVIVVTSHVKYITAELMLTINSVQKEFRVYKFKFKNIRN